MRLMNRRAESAMQFTLQQSDNITRPIDAPQNSITSGDRARHAHEEFVLGYVRALFRRPVRMFLTDFRLRVRETSSGKQRCNRDYQFHALLLSTHFAYPAVVDLR